MKFNFSFVCTAGVAAAVAAILGGCSTPNIPVTMDVAGEIKLNGVSKIAIAGFNTLKGDAFSGEMAADAETCALVKRAVASAFYASPMYQVIDLDAEQAVHDGTDAKPKKCFDAVVYGRVWWQIADETSGTYPKKMTLDTVVNVPYKQKVLGKEVPAVAPVTVLKKDVVEMLDYSIRNATLMLTLAVYRLEGNGEIAKIVDTYQVTNEGFVLENGEMKFAEGTRVGYEDMFVQKSASLGDVAADVGKALTAGFGSIFDAAKDAAKTVNESESEKAPEDPLKPKRDGVTGKIVLTQNTVAMPTELQAKLMLASSVSRSLGSKLAPSKKTFEVPADLGDDKLVNLLKTGAFKSAKEYALWSLYQKLGKEVCAKLAQFLPEFAEAPSFEIPASTLVLPSYNEELFDMLLKNEFNLSDVYFYTLGVSHEVASSLSGYATYNDELIAYLAKQELDIYFYALGVCAEATRDFDHAMEYHRFAFNCSPNAAAAQGMARVSEALGQDAKLAQARKAKKKAAKKTDLE